MRLFSLSFLLILFTFHLHGQVSFSAVDSKLAVHAGNPFTKLECSYPGIALKFSLKHALVLIQEGSIVTVDSQAIQLTLLKYKGKDRINRAHDQSFEKKLLNDYSMYELDYFKNELGIELINPNNQWVITKSRGWLVWYFKVGKIASKIDNPVTIQLFASTVVGDKILTLSAPILNDGNFRKAGIIVNDFMEAMIVAKQ